MKKISMAIITSTALLLGAPYLYAQEELPEEVAATQEDASCQNECPGGQSKVSFADGSRVSCVCSEVATAMAITPEEVSGEVDCDDLNDDGECG